MQISYEINCSLFGFVLNITDYGASTEYVDIGLIAINCFSQQSNRSSKIWPITAMIMFFEWGVVNI